MVGHSEAANGALFKKAVLKNFAISTENTCVGVYFLKNWRHLDLQLNYEETSTQVFSSEYCKIINTIYFEKHLQTAAF